MDHDPLDNFRNNSQIQNLGSNLLFFRDDRYPALGGGNKARKMMALHPSLRKGNFNALVTTGGIQSNHCRATALYGQKYQVKCTLVIHGEPEDFHAQSGNAKIIRESGAELRFCAADQISDTMDSAMRAYEKQGDRPYYLQGGGHTLEGGKAYIEEMGRLSKSGIDIERIFLPSGTGSTHAGILAGISKYGMDTQVIGISVGRTKERGEAAVGEFYRKLCLEYDIPQIGEVMVDDRFLCGGYQKYDRAIESIAKNSLIDYNVLLDTTYTAKAFHGMQECLKERPAQGYSMFWYTGGIYNYLAK